MDSTEKTKDNRSFICIEEGHFLSKFKINLNRRYPSKVLLSISLLCFISLFCHVYEYVPHASLLSLHETLFLISSRKNLSQSVLALCTKL